MRPKKIVVYSMAYRGDVFPYVPIASELARRGHDVVFVVPREYHPLFASEPFRCVHSGTDFSASAHDEHAAYVDRWGARMGARSSCACTTACSPFRTSTRCIGRWRPRSRTPTCSSLTRRRRRRSGRWPPRCTGSPSWSATCSPCCSPPSSHRSRACRTSVDWATGSRSASRSPGRPTDSPPPPASVRSGPTSVSPQRVGTSSTGVSPPPPTWGWYHRGTSSPDDGPPPVVVTLGTSAASARPKVFDAARAALDDVGARGLFLTSNQQLADHVAIGDAGRHLVRPFAPLAPVLERARAMVHSGAHGTNSLALRAGVPSVVVPCLFDQVVHARRQEELGTGVWVRKGAGLAPALRSVLDESNDHADHARRFAQSIAGANGVMATADEAERLLVRPAIQPAFEVR